MYVKMYDDNMKLNIKWFANGVAKSNYVLCMYIDGVIK